jgi:hypothetical protein
MSLNLDNASNFLALFFNLGLVPRMRKDAAEKNGTLLRSAGCVRSHIKSSFFTQSFKHFVGSAPALLLRSNRSLLMLLRRRPNEIQFVLEMCNNVSRTLQSASAGSNHR